MLDLFSEDMCRKGSVASLGCLREQKYEPPASSRSFVCATCITPYA